MTYSSNNSTYSSNVEYSSSSSNLYVVNNPGRKGACKGTCVTMGVCSCSI